MRILFVHKAFPGQYRHVAARLAADPANTVVFAAAEAGGDAVPGVHLRRFSPHREVRDVTHPYLRSLEAGVLAGQAAWRLARGLKAQGFAPDLICAHAGFGPGLYMKDVFPDTPVLSYFEWFYRSTGSDADFLLGDLGPDAACRMRTLNAAVLLELSACDWGTCPTRFQRAQFPDLGQGKLTVLHDGIDADFFSPDPTEPRRIGELDLSGAAEILTYATRGMDPYRGFPQFMRAAADLLARRPGLHVVVAGADEAPYGPSRADGLSWKQAMLRELSGLDTTRLHFTGPLPLVQYRRLLRITTVHVYLTVPFVLSWSLMEAMATGCAIVSSDTAPVREVMTDQVDGSLGPFHDAVDLARRVETLLEDPERRSRLGTAARRRILAHYRLDDLLPRHLRLMRNLAAAPAKTMLRRGIASDLDAMQSDNESKAKSLSQ